MSNLRTIASVIIYKEARCHSRAMKNNNFFNRICDCHAIAMHVQQQLVMAIFSTIISFRSTSSNTCSQKNDFLTFYMTAQIK